MAAAAAGKDSHRVKNERFGFSVQVSAFGPLASRFWPAARGLTPDTF